MESIEWEAVESPEYIAYCEANNFGYMTGVSKCRQWTQSKVWLSEDVTNKAFRIFSCKVYSPFTNMEAPEPYSVTSAKGTYIDPITARNNFLNKGAGILIPKGTFGNKELLPKFTVKYNGDENKT